MRHVVVLGSDVIGITPLGKLFLDADNDASGWTLYCGCAKVVSVLISGRLTSIALGRFTLEK